MNKIIILLLMQLFAINAANAQCDCTFGKNSKDWTPNMKRGLDSAYLSNSNSYFQNSLNGLYIAEDKDSIYQLKIIIDPKGFGTFVHLHHLQYYKYKSLGKNDDNKIIFKCDGIGSVRDGGMMGQNVFGPDKFWSKQYVSTEIFYGDNTLRLGRSGDLWSLWECNAFEKGLYFHDKKRLYKKVTWILEGNYVQASLKVLYQKDLKPYNKEQLATMRNEIFARYFYKFDEKGKYYAQFEKSIPYRWNVYDNVEPFLTTIEKENLTYIKGFETGGYYDNQQKNDFLDFWDKFRKAILSGNNNEIGAFVQFPYKVYGPEDDMWVIKINKDNFPKFWKILEMQESYGMDDNGNLITKYTKSIFQQPNAFDDQMIHMQSNTLNDLVFEKKNGVWKLTHSYADFENYSKIEKLESKK